MGFRWDSIEEQLEEVLRNRSDICTHLEILTVPTPEGFADDTPEDFARLGHEALKWTKGRTALCLGGGDTLLHEFRMNPEVTFHVWPVSRNRRGQVETTKLKNLPNNVVVHRV